jgi:hypothetical protein
MARFQLLVNEPTVLPSGKTRVTCTCIDEHNTTPEPCIRTAYEQLRSGLYNDGSQFILQENNLIIALSVKGAMLWLDNVPEPPYFNVPPSKRRVTPRLPEPVYEGP